jgi:hypothetical protein
MKTVPRQAIGALLRNSLTVGSPTFTSQTVLPVAASNAARRAPGMPRYTRPFR